MNVTMIRYEMMREHYVCRQNRWYLVSRKTRAMSSFISRDAVLFSHFSLGSILSVSFILLSSQSLSFLRLHSESSLRSFISRSKQQREGDYSSWEDGIDFPITRTIVVQLLTESLSLLNLASGGKSKKTNPFHCPRHDFSPRHLQPKTTGQVNGEGDTDHYSCLSISLVVVVILLSQ